MKIFAAELVGTLTLVLFGCGAAVLAGEQVGQLGIAFAFGLAIVAMAYGIGPISGCHVNPAVSFGAFVAGRMDGKTMLTYWVAQSIGLTLTAIHIVGIQVTGVSVNPARSFGPALFAGGQAMSQLWLFLVAPLVGAGLAGMKCRMGLLDQDAA